MKRSFWQYIGVVVCLILVDQISKQMIMSFFEQDRLYPVIDPGFSILIKINTGISFGLLQGQNPYAFWLMLNNILGIGLLLLALYYYAGHHRLLSIGFTLALAGCTSHFFERRAAGGVVDFIVVDWFSHRFPYVFNFADICIVMSAILLFYHIVYIEKELRHYIMARFNTPQ